MNFNRQNAAIRLFLATAFVLFVTLAATISLTWQESERLTASAQDNIQWGVTQVETELNKMSTALYRYGNSIPGTSYDDVLLRLDVLWSRINLFKTGVASQTFSHVPEAQKSLQAISVLLAQIEGRILALEKEPRLKAISVAETLLDLRPRAHTLGLDMFHYFNGETVRTRKVFQDGMRQSIYYLTGIFICSMTIGLLWILETRRANSLSRARDAALLEAQIADKAKSDFLSSMSHELRTPLNAIIGFSHMLKMNPANNLTDKQKEYTGYIIESGGYLEKLVEQVLDLSNIESGIMNISIDTFDVFDTLEECMVIARPIAQKNNITLINRVSNDDLPTLYSDKTRVMQVLMNFISNAIKYNRPGGTAFVDVEILANQKLRIRVEDTGPGIPDQFLDRIFIPFDRLGREALNIEGSGIGLAISKKIADTLGCDLGVETETGKGCKFWIDVPTQTGIS